MSPAAPPARRLVHDALFYDSADTLVDTSVRFVRQGVERGEVVLVVLTGGLRERRARALIQSVHDRGRTPIIGLVEPTET